MRVLRRRGQGGLGAFQCAGPISRSIEPSGSTSITSCYPRSRRGRACAATSIETRPARPRESPAGREARARHEFVTGNRPATIASEVGKHEPALAPGQLPRTSRPRASPRSARIAGSPVRPPGSPANGTPRAPRARLVRRHKVSTGFSQARPSTIRHTNQPRGRDDEPADWGHRTGFRGATRPRAGSASMIGSATRGRCCSRTRRTSRPCARPSSATWPRSSRSSTAAA